MISNLKIRESELQEIPILTQSVCAGIINPTFEQTELEYTQVPMDFLKGIKKPFLFTVQGDSMSPTILNGDIVIVDIDKKPRKNDVVIAFCDNEMYCKRYYFESAFPVLKSDNKIYPNIVITEDVNFNIIGVVAKRLTGV
jgi:SOS-response transcriptional repressor LexA